MAIIKTIEWGDGSGDNIYLTSNASEGNQTIFISSDANTGYSDRTKTITFTTTSGSPTVSATLTVTQSSKNIIIITYNDTAITQNDVAVGYE